MTLLEQLGQHVSDTLAAPTREDVQRQVKAHLLDCLAMVVAARHHPLTRRAAGVDLPGGERARLAVTAGAACDALGLDDFDEVTRTHPGAVVVAALLGATAAAAAPVHGRTFLRAVQVGYELTCRVGELLDAGRLHDGGAHPTAVCGVIGSAAAVSVLVDADAARAMGLAASLASGLYELDGEGAVKGLQTGWAAQSGIAAAALARAGYAPAPTVLDGPKGLLRVLGVEPPTPAAVAEALDGSPRIVRVSFKPYSHFTDLHPATAALLDLLRDHDVAADDIAAVDVHLVTGTGRRLNAVYPPSAPRLARRCPRFALAAVACRADRGVVADPLLGVFDRSVLHDEDILALGARVTWADDLPADGASPAAVVTLRLTDGTTATLAADGYPGDGRRAATRWSWDQVAERAGLLTPTADHELVEMVAQIDEAADVRPLARTVADRLEVDV